MKNWYESPSACFDLETTGADPKTARIVTASLILCDAAGKPDKTLELLADPGVEIPARATAVHGITTEQARQDGQHIQFVVEQIVNALDELFERNIPVIAYNAVYDFTVLLYECARHEVMPPEKIAPVIDPFVIDKQADPYRKGRRTLTALCELYNIDLEHAHTSADDALAALKLANKMAQKYRDYLSIPVQKLHDEQKQWKALQSKSFEDYLKKIGRFTEKIDPTWPAIYPEQFEDLEY
ncbi:MAG: 3'-5' exonuclease [Micrococcaceae bacterium]